MDARNGTTRFHELASETDAPTPAESALNDDRPAIDLTGLRLDEAIAAQAARSPARCAILFEGVDYSFAWLEDRASTVAVNLAARGVVRGDVVAVHLHRSPLMMAAMIGCLKAGAAYVPLDPGFPQARLDMVLEDAAPAAIITEAALDGVLSPPTGVPRLLIDGLVEGLDAAVGAAALGVEDLAYILYTSGSTGHPKGVEIAHGSVVNLLASFIQTPGFGVHDRMLAAVTTSFDMSVVELFLPLVAGGAMVLASAAEARDPERLALLIAQGDCTFAQATPSMWRYLLDSGWSGKRDLVVITGGEATTPDLADRLRARTRAVWNAYGPTETTVWSTLWRVQGGESPVPIGLPIAATTLHLVDDEDRDAVAGEVGELLIGGAGLARGYHGRPDLTRERFVWRGGERLYRTGDLARLRSDGIMECLGRTDHQVKIRGFRIELGDVEAALSACEGVGPCAVVAGTTAIGERELVAYVCAAPNAAPPQGAALRRVLAARLSDYMIPTRFVVIAALPLTPTGKIDRNALPAAPASDPADAAVQDARTDTEARLAAIWCAILGLAAVSRDDNFFDLGGYSLLTVTLLNRVREAFGRKLTMASLFAVRTLADMAAMLDAPEAPRAPDAILLQPQGARPPLIWLDAGPQLRPLAARLAPDQPLIGLTLDPLDGEFASGASIADLAQGMIAKLRRTQPQGPYYLGGWCRWGTVAHAVASRLADEGEDVQLLVLLDTVNHASPYQTFARMKGVARKSRLLRRTEAPLGFGEQVEAAAARYRPAVYPGDVLLLRASDAERDWDGRSGWSDAVRGRLEVVDLPGDHRSVLAAPFVDALATSLRSALDRAQARCG